MRCADRTHAAPDSRAGSGSGGRRLGACLAVALAAGAVSDHDGAMSSADPYALAAEAADVGRAETGKDRHQIAIVLGSGWAGATDRIGTVDAEIELSSIPGFPAPSVAGHRNQLRSLTVEGVDVLVFGGRAHLYEGHEPATVVHGVRTAAAAGCSTLILTNAAGCLRAEWPVGTLMLIEDHLNLSGASPMAGPPPPPDMPGRFSDMTEAYSGRLRDIALGVDGDLVTGVYAGLLGGNYETPAEIRMLSTLGADMVGMSTVLETIAARHLGLEVLGISLGTNLAAGLSPAPLDHAEVLEAAADAETRVVELIRGVVAGVGAA